jgi:kynurenine formamidase
MDGGEEQTMHPDALRHGVTRRDLLRAGAGAAAAAAAAGVGGGRPAAAAAPPTQAPGATSAFVRAVTGARLYDLSPVWEPDSPVADVNPPYSIDLADSHEDTLGTFDEHLSWASVTMHFSGQHGAPTLDALGHIAKDGTFFDGTPIEGSTDGQGLLVHDMTEFDPHLMVNRGVLLDVASHVNGDLSPLAPDVAVTGDLLDATARAQRTALRPGDTVLIRTGWGQFFVGDEEERALYRDGEDRFSAGVDVSGAEFLAERGARMVGNDTLVFEFRPPVHFPTGDPEEDVEIFPVHMFLIARQGIFIVENFWLEELAEDRVHEFVAVVPPLKVQGAAGSALRAFALVPDVPRGRGR